ncbi:TonB-dependent receptor [Colwellia sp. 1_MG-2023]|uniref:TonB-dependent receptor n=1 Tax=Colwellia sp. 1_MG-2023 TaxID=3062649 RepID=UPI0026E3A1D2|nr:TonB-dependent receptor [Colwellia sp. 1_MG-2023]MDO6446812.1 TonB-dependent receptor [Colwellia sp. 1_MG-2023]
MKTQRLSLISSAVILALGLSTSAMADDTSSAMRGTLVSTSGNAVTDATITIVHTPSGTKKTLTVNESGNFSAKGLRVGGPYTVTIDSDVYADKKLEGIYITLGDVFRISETLENEDIERISVTGSSNFYDPSKGSSSVFSGDDLSKSSAFNRDLKDIVRQNPMAVVGNDGVSLSLAGSNPRYNSLAVDGVNLNDDFGLAGNGYPTERSPISFDSIDQISVAIAPFTAKEGGFSGGKISVVTKSGTNDFSGSMFFEQAKDSWAGTPEHPDTNEDIDLSFNEESWGATLGGPIIKDTLFFFASYETFESPSSVDKGPSDANVANKVSQVSQAEVDRVVNIAQSKYGYDAGSWNNSIPLEDEKYSLKLDWNINDDHRASFTYSHGYSNSAGNQGAGNSDDLYLSSHWYNRSNEFDTYVGQLFSIWNENFSTEVKISQKESINGQIPLGGLSFGEAKIDTVNGGQIMIGPDDSRHANELTNETFQFRVSGEYLYEDHAISFGWEYEKVDVYNIFMQHYLGSWYFDSIDDFENGKANWFEYQNNPSLNRDDAAAAFSLGNHALYIEDSWDVTDTLNVTYGLRYELTINDDKPNANQGFKDRYGYSNDENLDGLDVFMPRVGFTWDATDELTIRGGVGRFSGGRPNVFISNAFTNDGSRIAAYKSFGDAIAESTFLQNADLNSVPQHAQDEVASAVLGGPNTNIDAIDPNFEIPTTMQYSLAADYVGDFSDYGLGDDWRISAEVLYKDNEKDMTWSDLSRTLDTSKGDNGYTVEGRPIYTLADPSRDNRDVLLTNTSGGHSLIETFSLAKNWNTGFKANFSYTHSSIRNRIDATGTSTNTAYNYNPVIDPENPSIGTSAYEVKHRLTLNLSYNTEVFDGYNTAFHMFWERKSGRPYSYLLGWNNRDGISGELDLTSANLPYIPTGADDGAVDFVNGLSYNEIIGELSKAGISSAGGYLPKNGYRAPWTTTLDLRLEQELPGFMEGHKGLIYFDIKNALAIFDEDAARVYQLPFGQSATEILDYSINDAGQYVYESANISQGESPVEWKDRESTWSMKIGVKYTF